MKLSNALMIGLAAFSFTFCKREEKVNKQALTNERLVGTEATTYTYVIKTTESIVDASALKIPAGAVVGIESGTRGPLLLKNFVGTEGNPIIIVNKGGKVSFDVPSSNSYSLKFQNSKYFRITGSGVSTIKYGIDVNGGHIGVTFESLTTDFEADNLEIRNSGFAGFMAKTDPSCDQSTWRGNFTMRNIKAHDNYVHNVTGEGFYIGNSFYASGRALSCGTILPHSVENVKLYNNITKATGCEGIQVGCAISGCEIYNNQVDSPGQDPFAAAQNNGIQIGEGTGGKLYNNLVTNTPGNGLIILGLGDNVIYNNVVVNSGASGIFCDERYTPGNGFAFLNNTIINSKVDGIRLYSEKVAMNTFINNIVVGAGSGKYINPASGVKLTQSNNITSANIADLKFTDATTNNYALLTGSPAIDKGADVKSYGVLTDYKGAARPQGTSYDIGAYEFGGTASGGESSSGGSSGGSTTTPPSTGGGTTTPPATVAQSVTGMRLLNASTQNSIGQLSDGYVITSSKVGTSNYNIIAATNPGTVGSVVFTLNGVNKIQNAAPYSYFGSSNGKYNGSKLAKGTYTLVATPYSGTNGTGTKGTAKTIKFFVQ